MSVMVFLNRRLPCGVIVVLCACGLSRGQTAQTKPWRSFQDVITGTVCDTVNANNAQLVVDAQTNHLVIVSGSDIDLADAIMTDQGFVTFEDNPGGTIDFATDGDGNTRLFWMTLTGSVVNVNAFTGEPSDSRKAPDDFSSVRCDACPLWDDPKVCDTSKPPDNPPPTTTFNLCGVDVPVTVGMIGLLLLPLRALGASRRRSARRPMLER